MKIIKRNIDITSNKVEKSIKLFGISDLHFQNKTKLDKLNSIKRKVLIENPNYIVFCGDLIDNVNNILDEKLNDLYDFFEYLASNYKIIFIKGNHDLRALEENQDKINSFFKKISKLKNLYLLDGVSKKSVKFDDVTFYGLELTNEFYGPLSKDEWLVEGCNDVLSKIDEKEYNIFLFHSPISLLSESVKNLIPNLNKVDLIMCGHMHNGLIPNFMDMRKRNFGLLSPTKGVFPKLCRNVVNVSENTKALIMYPLSFYYRVELLHLEFLFRPGYQIINIKNNIFK